MNLLSYFKSNMNPRYKIVERASVNHVGEILQTRYVILERRWCIIYFYIEMIEDHGDHTVVYSFDNLKQAEEYLAKRLTPKIKFLDTVIKEIL